jgi:hypothetical protein
MKPEDTISTVLVRVPTKLHLGAKRIAGGRGVKLAVVYAEALALLLKERRALEGGRQ